MVGLEQTKKEWEEEEGDEEKVRGKKRKTQWPGLQRGRAECLELAAISAEE